MRRSYQLEAVKLLREIAVTTTFSFSPVSVIALNAYIELTEKYSDHSYHTAVLPA
jgi:hypothetical protein